MPSPMLRMSIPLLIGMNKVLIVFQDEYDVPLWRRTDGITTFRWSIIHCCYLYIEITYIQKFSRKDFTHGRQLRNTADQIISFQNIPICWSNSCLRDNIVVKTWLVFQKSSWEWHLCSEVFFKMEPCSTFHRATWWQYNQLPALWTPNEIREKHL